ncbi:MAG: histidine-type phosphatase [Prevotellaceae bacterium]|jgi:hypothetical protein|nr:histidine-type phosphatase [Prevotellaceae bacterium]
MKPIYSFFILLLLFAHPAAGQTSKEELFEAPEKTGGVYYAYPAQDIKPQTPAPEGYAPFYIAHFGRHGSRYLIEDNDYKQALDLFEEAMNSNALTPLGIDVHKRLSEVWKEAEGRGGDLSPLGVRQQRGIAERMFRLYPDVFRGNIRLSARSTTVARCILSMDTFCERLKELNPELHIARDTSSRSASYLNYHTEAAVAFRSENGAWKKEYEIFENAHVQPRRLVQSLFADAAFTAAKINPASLMWALYWIASDMQNMEARLSFYDIFEKQELFDLWQCKNYSLYVRYANAAANGGIMMENAKPLLKNIIESANQAIEAKGYGASFRFGHDGNIIPLAMLLHLQGCYGSISESSEFYKAWSDFKVAPMAGNVQIIFFRKENSEDILVKFLLNENEMLVPPVKSSNLPYYRWKDVVEYYNSL